VTERDHNVPHLLVIRYFAAAPARQRAFAVAAGWYVVRVCACHWGQRVSLPYPTAERAARVRRVILGWETTRSEPRLLWREAAS
jgi:hypothetical protein